MWQTVRFALAASIVPALGPGCSSNSEPTPRADLVGDWLPCASADCSEIGDDGYRFLADGTAMHINGQDTVVSGAPICVELEASAGAYYFDGAHLSLEGMTITTELVGDRLTLHDVPFQNSDGSSGLATVQLRRLATYVGAPCPSDAPQI
jgi:FlaG/FlaF family flagellin (archaellin)